MSLRYVLGLPGSGKTNLCMEEILKKDAEPGARPVIFIVPEQYSMQAEKNLVQKSAASAVAKAQALSFQRLAFHLFSKTGLPKGAFLDDTGKSMLLRKIVLDLRSRLVFYGKASDKKGFIDGLSRVITEFYQYGIKPDDLKKMEGAAESESLRSKISDLSMIFQNYIDVMKDRYFSMDATLDFIPDKISESDFLDGANVWIDGFHGFTMQERKILTQIMRKAERVTVTAIADEKAASFPALPDYDFFYETKLTLNKLTTLAREENIAVEEPVFLQRKSFFPEMDFFIKNYFKRRVAVYPKSALPAGFKIIAAKDREEEVAAAAEHIVELSRDKGFRYRDVAVLASDVNSYEKILRRVFDQFGILLFVDIKSDILSHPLTELIRSAVDIASKHWSYESVFRFLKTDMTGIPMEDIDLLENYVLEYGVKGRQWQLEEWKHGDGLEDIMVVKEQVQQALYPFVKDASNRKETVKTFAARLYAMIEHLKVPLTLEKWIQEAAFAGDNEAARRHSQIWGKINAVFDKMVEILGDEKTTVPEFAKILDAGLATANMGVIPPSVDQVVMGELTRSRLPEVKTLIVLGANDGMLPKLSSDDSFFSDDERLFLQSQGIETAHESKRRIGEEQFLLYCGLAKPQEQLVLSYSLTSGGKPIRPSSVLVKLMKMYPGLVPEQYAPEETVTLARPMIGRMGALLKRHMSGEELLPVQKDAYAILKKDEVYTLTIDKFEEFIRSSGTPKKLGRETAGKLYGKEISTSISRLEKYAECPFGYFLTYNLKARERKIYAVSSIDAGNLFHNVLERFSQMVVEERKSWKELDNAAIGEMVDLCIDEISPEVGASIFTSAARLVYMLKRIRRICKRSIWALSEHIKNGSFTPLGSEISFTPSSPLSAIELSLNGERKLLLTGRIDRIDIMESGGRRYVKIIDYKSGSKRFDLDDVYFGTQLQLLIYLNAFIKNAAEYFGDEAEMETLPGGIFYFNINDPIIDFQEDVEAEGAKEKLEKLILKTFKMTGLVLSDDEAINGLHQGLSGASDIIPVSIKKDGTLGARSSAAEAEEFKDIQQSVEEKIIELGNDIASGKIDAFPYKKGQKTACEYCLFGAICALEISERPNKYHYVKKAPHIKISKK
jgi:ATP-dependent helicase/nuclease subunit B